MFGDDVRVQVRGQRCVAAARDHPVEELRLSAKILPLWRGGLRRRSERWPEDQGERGQKEAPPRRRD
jgi:hypothetical protein